jgi:hypothetical protein
VVGLRQIGAIKLNEALNDYINAQRWLTTAATPSEFPWPFSPYSNSGSSLTARPSNGRPSSKTSLQRFQSDVFEPLLLPLRSQMERLARVEVYLEQRHREGQGRSAIFYDTTDAESFVSLFVSQSTPLQALLQRMEHHEERAILRKEQEMVKVNAHYEAVKAEMDAAPCTECRT